jgi:VWFA-related protein
MRACGCVCFLTVAAAAAAHAQVFRSRVDMVGLTVTVTDTRGLEITGLTADNFVVFEDGVQQHVSLFGGDKVPVDVALVLDMSGSMQMVQPAVKKGAIALLAKLRDGDRTIVVDVKRRIQMRSGLDADRSSAVASVNGLSANGGTALYDGLYISLQEFARARRQVPEMRRQAIVVFSDGLDNESHVRFEDVSELARALDVVIYTITMHADQLPQVIPFNTAVRRALWEMRALTLDTGGRAFFPTTATELPRVYDAVARELGNQYTLAYVAPAASQRQALRRIAVRLVPPAQGVARTRTGYLANRGEVQLRSQTNPQ